MTTKKELEKELKETTELLDKVHQSCGRLLVLAGERAMEIRKLGKRISDLEKALHRANNHIEKEVRGKIIDHLKVISHYQVLDLPRLSTEILKQMREDCLRAGIPERTHEDLIESVKKEAQEIAEKPWYE